ncbi:MAG: hypothetical protein OET44_21070 [Gammaproteobacteria bacterium]|nr:hypothetical protein [Gammaproteobacteria bacterium]
MSEERRLQWACLGFGYFVTAIPLLVHAVFNPKMPMPNFSLVGALMVFPFIAALLAAWIARWFDPLRFGPLRAVVLVVLVFLALCLVESGIWIVGSPAGDILNAVGALIIVIAFGAIMCGWIMLLLGLAFGAFYRRQTIKRMRETVSDVGEASDAVAEKSTTLPRMTPRAETDANAPGEVSRLAETVEPREPGGERSRSQHVAPEAAGWPLEDFPEAAVARWGQRIAWLHPVLLAGAVVVGLLSGDLQQGEPWLIVVATIVVYPAYVLIDSIVNAQFYASSLRGFALPLAQGVGNSFVGGESIIVPSLLFAACYLAVALLIMTIVRWHRMLQANESAANTEPGTDRWLIKWGPKIGYPYLVVAAVYWFYDEAFNARISLSSITLMYIICVLVLAGLVAGKRRLKRV